MSFSKNYINDKDNTEEATLSGKRTHIGRTSGEIISIVSKFGSTFNYKSKD